MWEWLISFDPDAWVQSWPLAYRIGAFVMVAVCAGLFWKPRTRSVGEGAER